MPCLSSCLPTDRPGGAALDDEEARPVGGLGQDGVEVGDAAVGDELLGAVEAVAGDVAGRVDDARRRVVLSEATLLPASGSVTP